MNQIRHKCGYCGWLFRFSTNFIEHECFKCYIEGVDHINVDENYVVTLVKTNPPVTNRNENLNELLIEAVKSGSLYWISNNDLFFKERSNNTQQMVKQFCRHSTMSEFTQVQSNKIFGGWQKVYSHNSTELGCKMKFAVYLPPQVEERHVPVIYWLSGLTCTEANFSEKAGAQRHAANYGVLLVIPDTSPRGLNIPGEDDSYDFGSGAGFYVDATSEPWKKNYRMYSYVTKELPALINKEFPTLPDRQSIIGHSMGGHGALICALKNPGQYRTVSAFAPISNPILCPWGKKAFLGYLGGSEDDVAWKEWDATELARKYNGPPLDILIDQGKEDQFLKQGQLLPENLLNAAKDNGIALALRFQDGYDHSYYFIATFIEDHFKHHIKYLNS